MKIVEIHGKKYNIDDPCDRYAYKIEASKDIYNYLNNTVNNFSRNVVKDIKKLVKKNSTSRKPK